MASKRKLPFKGKTLSHLTAPKIGGAKKKTPFQKAKAVKSGATTRSKTDAAERKALGLK